MKIDLKAELAIAGASDPEAVFAAAELVADALADMDRISDTAVSVEIGPDEATVTVELVAKGRTHTDAINRGRSSLYAALEVVPGWSPRSALALAAAAATGAGRTSDIQLSIPVAA